MQHKLLPLIYKCNRDGFEHESQTCNFTKRCIELDMYSIKDTSSNAAQFLIENGSFHFEKKKVQLVVKNVFQILIRDQMWKEKRVKILVYGAIWLKVKSLFMVCLELLSRLLTVSQLYSTPLNSTHI